MLIGNFPGRLPIHSRLNYSTDQDRCPAAQRTGLFLDLTITALREVSHSWIHHSKKNRARWIVGRHGRTRKREASLDFEMGVTWCVMSMMAPHPARWPMITARQMATGIVRGTEISS